MIDTETECNLCSGDCPCCGRDLQGKELAERFALEMSRKDKELREVLEQNAKMREVLTTVNRLSGQD